jgi:hypothetical protein
LKKLFTEGTGAGAGTRRRSGPQSTTVRDMPSWPRVGTASDSLL